jgi:hypothetical protein
LIAYTITRDTIPGTPVGFSDEVEVRFPVGVRFRLLIQRRGFDAGEVQFLPGQRERAYPAPEAA